MLHLWYTAWISTSTFEQFGHTDMLKADGFVLCRMSTGCSSVTLHKSCRMNLGICLSNERGSIRTDRPRFDLIWTPLDLAVLIRRDWTRFDVSWLHSNRLYSIRFHFTPTLNVIGLDLTWLDSLRLCWNRFDLTGLDLTWFDSIRLYWTRFELIIYSIRSYWFRFDFRLLHSTWLHSIGLDFTLFDFLGLD